MQWPYCHGYGTVENINQACTCNREKDGGRRDRKKTAMRETEGGRRGKEDNGTVYMCLCVRAWFYVCFDEYICKSHDFWASVCSCPKLGGEWIFDSFVKKIFLNEKKKKKSHSATIKTRLAHICTEKSHKCGMSSIQNSFHTGVNSLFSSQRFVLAPSLYFRLNFMCPNVCWYFLSEGGGGI